MCVSVALLKCGHLPVSFSKPTLVRSGPRPTKTFLSIHTSCAPVIDSVIRYTYRTAHTPKSRSKKETHVNVPPEKSVSRRLTLIGYLELCFRTHHVRGCSINSTMGKGTNFLFASFFRRARTLFLTLQLRGRRSPVAQPDAIRSTRTRAGIAEAAGARMSAFREGVYFKVLDTSLFSCRKRANIKYRLRPRSNLTCPDNAQKI